MLSEIHRLYPIEQVDEYIPYSREALIDSINKGYASVLMVPGKNAPYHYVVPYKILDNDVSVIDNKFKKNLVSQYKEAYYIVNFRRISKIKVTKEQSKNPRLKDIEVKVKKE